MKIEKKVWPEFFSKILSGDKTFELRLADFACKRGDDLILREWDTKTKKYTGRVLEKKVTYVLKTRDVKFWPKKEVERHGFQIIGLGEKATLCSACLLGIRCRYDGRVKPNIKVLALAKTERLIPVCPELFGGQSTPRPNAEIKGGRGVDVLKGRARVVESDGNDVSRYFVRGAKEVLRQAKLFKAKQAILKQRSPSCGSGQIYDGTFSGKIVKGDGVTSALLKQNGITVISEEDLELKSGD